jgi:hypothetical protein
MKRWTVCYTEKRIMEVIVEADTQEEAEGIVIDGGADYDSSVELDAEVLDINSSEFYHDSEISEEDDE